MSAIPIGQIAQPSVIIANGGTTSPAIPTEGAPLVGVIFPAALTSTTMTFTVCNTLSGTYVPLKNSSGAVSYTVAAGEYMAINASDFYGVTFFKIVLGSAEGAARTLILSLKGF